MGQWSTTIVDTLLHTAASLALLAVVFVPLERAFIARKNQPIFRPELGVDVLFFIGQYVFFVAATTAGLQLLVPVAGGLMPASVREGFATWPLLVQGVLVVVAADVVIYWGHRFSHQNDFLWRFHAVHHSAHDLDWVAAHREHPVDGAFTMLLVNLPAFLLGFPLEILAPFLVVRGMWSIFIHSNVRMSLGVAGLLFGDPVLHRWHHAKLDRTLHNFANVAPYLDVLFGTHHRPTDEQYALGLTEDWPRGYFAQLKWAFVRPRRG